MTPYAQYMFCSFVLGALGSILDNDNGKQKLSFYGAVLKAASIIYFLGAIGFTLHGTTPSF